MLLQVIVTFVEHTLTTEIAAMRPQLAIPGDQSPTKPTGGLPGTELSNGAEATTAPPPPSTPIALSQNQLDTLKAQMQAFKLISRNQPIPPQLQRMVYAPEQSIDADSSQLTKTAETNGSNAEGSSPKVTKAVNILPDGPIIENDTSSAIYPYNAYSHPASHTANVYQHGVAHKYIIPSIMPLGLDPALIQAERNRFIDARIAHRIRELSALPSTIGDGALQPIIPMEEDETGIPPSSTKLRALIELKALKLRDKQRALRSSVVNRLQDASSLAADRKVFRRARKITLRDSRATEALERKQRIDRERRAKQKHLDYLNAICEHGRYLIVAGNLKQQKAQKLGKAVLKFHVDTEKEEQKRIERISKERLKALKADDEEAYMKLIDTAKDTRITHLLRQTDTYLDSLAQAVRAQQNDDVHRHGAFDHMPFETEDGPTDETTFGASRPEDEDPERRGGKVDYYGVAHKISEKVTTQPSLLIGGQLKEYQLKGLQWMVSLYNNRLNGILADEMVCLSDLSRSSSNAIYSQGLGKTIQTISLICFLIERKREPGPFLVIVPLSTLTNWTLEFKKWAPGVPTLVYNSPLSQRKALTVQLRSGQYQVVLTTYEYIIREKASLSRLKWVHMIIDEGHRMKNTQSKLSQTLTQFYSTKYRIILTGTPLQVRP